MQRELPEDDRSTDCHHDDPELVAAADRPYREHLEKRADRRGQRDCGGDCDRQRKPELEEPYAEHPAKHEELALREVDRAGRGEDDGEPERDESVDSAALEPGDDELEELLHATAFARIDARH